MKREYEAINVICNLSKLELDSNMAVLEFVTMDGMKIIEELDLLNTHELFRFSMFLESLHIKNLKHARKLLNIFIREGIEIELVVDRQFKIIYSNMLAKDQLYEFKKHILLDKLISEKKLSKEMYEELKTLEYKEVRKVIE
jgi:hypothetical protein